MGALVLSLGHVVMQSIDIDRGGTKYKLKLE